jgi:hypothetical protein
MFRLLHNNFLFALAILGISVLISILIYLLIFKGRGGKEKYKVISTGSKKGKEIMKKYNVIFAGTIRNVEKYIEKGLFDIDQCGKKFNDYAVILYENDSNDKTRSILEQHKKENYHYIFEDNVSEPLRTKRLANGRNKILEKMQKINKDKYYHYFIMLDMDDVNQSGTFVNSIETCFEYENWDVLTGNQSQKYYDLWALRKKNDMDYDCWEKVKNHFFKIYAKYKYVDSKFKNYPRQEGLLEVDSAFGGAAIYKIESIPSQCKYVGTHANGNEKCEHVEFNECIKKNGGAIFINSAFLTS